MPTLPSSRGVIEVRKALTEDYEAVMEINRNVYQGTDYMVNQYHTMVTDPDFCYYVCLVDGEVAAFEGICHLDDEKTMMLKALRIKAKFQGGGLSTEILKKIYADHKDLPGKRRLRLGCSDESRFVKSTRFRKKNTLLKMERRVRFHDFDVRQMTPVSANEEDEVKPISWEDFRHLIQTKSVKNYLYPDNLMTQDYWCYEAIPGNIRHLEKRCPLVFATKNLDKFLSTKKTDGEKPESAGDKEEIIVNGSDNISIEGAIGIVSSYFTPTYLYIGVNLSGKLTEDNKEMKDVTSILKQTLSYAQGLNADDPEDRKMMFFIVCDYELPEELFYEVAKPFGLEPTRTQENFRDQYYFEQDFDNLGINP